VIQANLNGATQAVDWGAANATGRQRAIELIAEMRETGNVALLLGEIRRMDDPLYGAFSAGFFACIASALAST